MLVFIERSQNEDGGWGYGPDKSSYTEPTGVCLLALKTAGRENCLVKGLEFLKKCQLDSGGTGINREDETGNWMAYSALLAFHALEASQEKKRIQNWILDFYDGQDNVTQSFKDDMYEQLKFDATLDGWPWFGNTNSWIEPTSMLIVSLLHSGLSLQNRRIQEGLKLLINRKNKNGGWNYGNPYVKNTWLEAFPLSTSIALLALGTSGYSEKDSTVKSAVAYLEPHLHEDPSVALLAWSLLAFKAFNTTNEKIETLKIALTKKQLLDGSFRGNLFETALSFLALSDFKFTSSD